MIFRKVLDLVSCSLIKIWGRNSLQKSFCSCNPSISRQPYILGQARLIGYNRDRCLPDRAACARAFYPYSIKASTDSYGVWDRHRMESYSINIEYRAIYVNWSPGKNCTASHLTSKHSLLSTVRLPNQHLSHDIIWHAPNKMRTVSVGIADIEKK